MLGADPRASAIVRRPPSMAAAILKARILDRSRTKRQDDSRRTLAQLYERLEIRWKIGRAIRVPAFKAGAAIPLHGGAIVSRFKPVEIQLTVEQQTEADRIKNRLKPEFEAEFERILQPLASTTAPQVLGQPEFELGNRVQALIVEALEITVDERSKRTASKSVAVARTSKATPASSTDALRNSLAENCSKGRVGLRCRL